MLGIYLQRSWVVFLVGSILLLLLFIFAIPILKLTGQPEVVADFSGKVPLWLIPMHMSFVFQFSLVRFLQGQLKTVVIGALHRHEAKFMLNIGGRRRAAVISVSSGDAVGSSLQFPADYDQLLDQDVGRKDEEEMSSKHKL